MSGTHRPRTGGNSIRAMQKPKPYCSRCQ